MSDILTAVRLSNKRETFRWLEIHASGKWSILFETKNKVDIGFTDGDLARKAKEALTGH